MKTDSVLFKIKSLEQAIFRFIFSHVKFPEDMKIPTPTQMQIVGYILKHPKEDIYQKDLENILNLRRATVSGVLGTMEKNHLIKRVVDDKDTRTKKIILNSEMEKCFKEHINEITRLETKGLSQEELEIFTKVINQMKKNVEYTNN